MGVRLGKLIAMALLLAMALSAQAQTPFYLNSGPRVPPQSGLTLDMLQRKIDQSQLTTVNQVLNILPAEFRTQHVLIRDSQSLQKSEPPTAPGKVTKPRVIIYGGRGLIAAFTHPSLPGGDAIEFLQFLPPSRWTTGEFKENRGLEKNPQKCMQCHGSPTRLIWEAYSCWPQSYAGNDDELTSREQNELRKFIGSLTPDSRYSVIEGALPPYLEPITDPLNGRPVRISNTPNINFTRYIHSFDDLRTVQIIKQSPLYSKLKYAIIYAMTSCGLEKREIDEELVAPNMWTSLKPLLSKIGSGFASTYSKRYENDRNRVCDVVSPFGNDTPLLSALMQWQGVNDSQLSTSFDPADPKATNHPDMPFRFQFLVELMAKGDRDLPESVINSCKTLRKLSFAATRTLSGRPAAMNIATSSEGVLMTDAALNQKAAATFAKCIACHSSGIQKVPSIPFSDAAQFRQWLTPAHATDLLYRIGDLSVVGFDHMPLIGALSAYERVSIESYVKSVGSTPTN